MVELRCPQEPVTPNASLRVIPKPKVTEGRVSQLRDALSCGGTTGKRSRTSVGEGMTRGYALVMA